MLFPHQQWAGTRFGHRFPTPGEADSHEHIWLTEEIGAGALDRLMTRHPDSDREGIIWRR